MAIKFNGGSGALICDCCRIIICEPYSMLAIADAICYDCRKHVCPLCERPIPKHLRTEHHLVPKVKGGKNAEKAEMHNVCHGKIHSVFTESELANEYNTVEKLLGNEEISKFVKWVKRKPADFDDSNRMHNRRK